MAQSYITHPGENLHRGLTDHLWRDMPTDYMNNDPRKGMFLFDDFNAYQVGSQGWVERDLNSSSGTVTQQGFPGVIRLDAAATTADHGEQIDGADVWQAAAGRLLCFEALVNVIAFDADGAMVIGLGDAAASIGATQLLAIDDFMGFVMEVADTSWQAWGEKAGAANTASGVGTIAAGWIKLGFRVKDLTTAEFYVNGVQQAKTANLAAANIPTVKLAPIFATCNESGTGTQHKLDVDWVAIGNKSDANVLS